MARVSVKHPLKFDDEQKLLDKLFLALSSLGNWQEAETFFSEFLTEQEMLMLAKRLELVKRVLDKQKYKMIIKEMNVTSQTVSDMRKKMQRADAFFVRILRKFLILDKRL